jgi:hypothetical protein
MEYFREECKERI